MCRREGANSDSDCCFIPTRDEGGRKGSPSQFFERHACWYLENVVTYPEPHDVSIWFLSKASDHLYPFLFTDVDAFYDPKRVERFLLF